MRASIPEDIHRIVILTGAGISAESGLRTFRDADGLWEGHRVDDVATPEAFARNPELVHAFYNARRRQLLDGSVEPNAAHHALARLEAALPGEVLVITQNVDDLHERAGTRNLLHMHGELRKARCRVSGMVAPCDDDLSTSLPCDCCGRPGNLRPHIVWFGEIPLHMDDIERALSRCDLFVSIGTSGQVWPAAGFVRMARAAGARTLTINAEPAANHSLFDEHWQGRAGTLVPKLTERLLARAG